MLRTILLSLGLVMAAGVVAVASFAMFLLHTDAGRARLCAEANARVSRQMAGSLHIEGIDAIDWPFVTAHGVKLVAPDGMPAIDVPHATVQLDTHALLEGRFAWLHADVRGGIVRVTEDSMRRVNMEETFRARVPEEDNNSPSDAPPLDLRTMVTHDTTLVIHGGNLPDLRLTHLSGVMRVTELPNGVVDLRFDDYHGEISRGLPTGRLVFRDVRGYVQTAHKRLLRFYGRGTSEGEPVFFSLDVERKPRVRAYIYARFPRLSAEAVSTLGFAGYTKFTKQLELDVRPGLPAWESSAMRTDQ